MCMRVFRLTSQTRAAVVVFPTPGGPESRAALYPDPSSFPPPNLPNLATAQQETKQSRAHALQTQIHFSEMKIH